MGDPYQLVGHHVPRGCVEGGMVWKISFVQAAAPKTSHQQIVGSPSMSCGEKSIP